MLRADVKKALDKFKDKNCYINTKSNSYLIKKGTVLTIKSWFLETDTHFLTFDSIKSVTKKKALLMSPSYDMIGADPELFFVKDDEVVPSNEVVPVDGDDPLVIRDGFQGELNPTPDGCRQAVGISIRKALLEAEGFAKRTGSTISFKIGHIITDEVWKRTPLGLRRFGCNPTENVHETKFKRVTGTRERFRSAGGHIHVSLMAKNKKKLPELIALMDIVVGNTCVLIDRDPDNARRRRHYGRAGEHRVKEYGVEYRVLSNFWLRSYVLWCMVSALSRNAVAIRDAGLGEELISRFDMIKVRKAINNNDYELAKENFHILADFIDEYNAIGNGLSAENVNAFYKWATSDEPLEKWDTTEKVMNEWRGRKGLLGIGFERFIENLK